SWFGAYHYGLLKSFAEAGKSALGMGGGGGAGKPPVSGAGAGAAEEEPRPGARTKAEEIAKGWDRLALLGLVTMVLYPYIFDKGAKLLTGDEHARVRRPGPFGYVDAATQVAERKQSASSAMQKVVTPRRSRKARQNWPSTKTSSPATISTILTRTGERRHRKSAATCWETSDNTANTNVRQRPNRNI